MMTCRLLFYIAEKKVLSVPKILSHLPALTNMVRRIAVDAGAVTLEYFDESGCAHDVKDDGSPVTMADRRAEALIAAALRDITPDVPVIAEEAAGKGLCAGVAPTEYMWLVDPLDGTREFISGSLDYTVNIALVQNGVPVLGVVYAPARGELYAASGAGTAIRWLEETGAEKSIHVRKPPAAGLTVVSSRSHDHDRRLDAFLDCLKVEKLTKRGSSLKLCAVAGGKADLYPRFGITSEWDTAAGHAVLTGAGGVVTDFTGAALTYGRGAAGWKNPEFIAHAGILDFTEALN